MSGRQGIPAERIEVIHNGVMPHPDYPEQDIAALRTKYGFAADDEVLGSLGRLDDIKGYDRLLRVFARLCRERKSLKLLLVGDGPSRAKLERQASELGIGERVVFAGFQEESRKFLELMDWFILSSWSEGLSVALLEAMAANVPVLVTDVGSNREVIANGEAGVLLPDDEGQWPAVAAEAMADRAGTGEKAVAARLRVERDYSLQTTLDKYERIYESLR